VREKIGNISVYPYVSDIRPNDFDMFDIKENQDNDII